MTNDFSDLLAVGLPAVLGGLLLLGLMVHRELGPFAGLGAPGRWMLTGAFGMGILAFALKMAVAAVVTGLPHQVVDPLVRAFPDRTPTPAPAPMAADAGSPLGTVRHSWQTLPDQVPSPADDPPTPAKIDLGRRLFFERRLSRDGTLSCASCHDLEGRAGGDGRATARGLGGRVGNRNTPTVWNAAFQAVFFWDGRAGSLEEQAAGPILNPLEMGMPSPGEAEARIAADPSYRAAFARAFGDDGRIGFDRITRAIAAFERTLVTADSAYDRFVRGDRTALTPPQLRGMALFESVGCVGCHRGPNFSAASLAAGDAPFRLFPANRTAYETKYDLLLPGGGPGVWRVPSLRNVALTGPWLHNGSVRRLEEVVRIMAATQLGRTAGTTAWIDASGRMNRIDRAPLADSEVADLVAFLEALSSEALRQRDRPIEVP